jgi:hypothetical protein
MLQPGLIQALKGNPDGLVVAVLSVSAGAICIENAWAGLGFLAVSLLLYHVRRTTAEAHERKMARLRVDEQFVRVERITTPVCEDLALKHPKFPVKGSWAGKE